MAKPKAKQKYVEEDMHKVLQEYWEIIQSENASNQPTSKKEGES